MIRLATRSLSNLGRKPRASGDDPFQIAVNKVKVA